MGKIYIIFIFSSMLTILLCIIGYDDIVYNFMKRKPTGEEAVKRILFVITKMSMALSGGGVFIATASIFIKKFLLEEFWHVDTYDFLSKDNILFFILISMFVLWGIIGAIQNFIRRIQGRLARPLYDFSILRHNLSQWSRPRK